MYLFGLMQNASINYIYAYTVLYSIYFIKYHYFFSTTAFFATAIQYQVGNTSSRKIAEVKQLGPWIALGWVTILV